MRTIRFCVAIVFILVPLISQKAQTETPSKAAPDNSKINEGSKLAAEVFELYKQGKYKEALPPAKRCLQIRESLFTPADEALRTALNNLAEIYLALRKYEEAAPVFQRLIKSYEEFAPTDVRLIKVLQGLALVKFATGQHSQTEMLYRRALEMTENAYPSDEIREAASVSYLADYYMAVGEFKKAEPLYQRMFAIREKQNPSGDSEEYRQARDRYACLLHKTGREEEARALEKPQRGPDPKATPVSGFVINGKALVLPKPSYPEEARAARAEGTVVVKIVIDENGKVIHACAVRGPSLLMRASEAAAYRAVFTPTKLNGQSVKVTGVVSYNFVHQ